MELAKALVEKVEKHNKNPREKPCEKPSEKEKECKKSREKPYK